MQVQLIRVFVSSPGDVAAERAVVDDVVAAINRTDGQADGFRLETFRWEQNVTPQIGPKPQAVVDRQTPEYDVLVGIMSTRFGTPSGPYGSGTEKEFKDALKRWKAVGRPWIAFYFDDAPRMSSKPEEVAQYLKVCQFRELLQKQGIFRGYQGVRGKSDGFYELLSEHLRCIARTVLREKAPVQPGQPAPASVQQVVADPAIYLRDLCAKTQFIDIRGLQTGKPEAKRFSIEDLFISLTTTQTSGDDLLAPGGKTRRGREVKPDGEADCGVASHTVPLHQALRHDRLVVVGNPGAGKTTFLRRVTHTLCQTELGQVPPDAVSERLGIADRTFPIFIRIDDLAKHLVRHGDQPGAPEGGDAPAWLIHYLAAACRSNVWNLDGDFFRQRLEDGRCTVLLDGLDEAPNRLVRERVARLIESVTRAYGGCRFVVTSRETAYVDQAVLPDFDLARIDPLSDEAVKIFLTRWCEALYAESRSTAREHLDELLAALDARPDIRRMTRNPVMLTAMAVVHWNESRLPEQRADLYESIIRWLSRSREQRTEREKAERTVELLRELALCMQDHPQGMQLQVARRWAAEQLAPQWGTGPGDHRAVDIAEAFLHAEEVDSGIVVADGPDIRFWHRTFQEFLAARAIAARLDEQQNAILWDASPPRFYRPEWQEVVLLLAGILHGQGAAKVDHLIRTALARLGDRAELADQARCAGLLGGIVRDLQPVDYQPPDSQFQQLLDRVMAIFDRDGARQVPVPQRIAAAEALGQAGDSRLDFARVDYWVTIPAGEFQMGSQKQDSKQSNYDPEGYGDESPVHEVYLDTYRIARYPVTVRQFQRFVEHEGYDERRWWTAGGFGQFETPEAWDEQLQHPSRPVVGVSWYEAAAFCAWATQVLQKLVSLPTEAQWERAARGTAGRKYPWGNAPPDAELLNYAGNVGHPTPVGIYPLGNTPEDISDLAGNVLEWCWDWSESYMAAAVSNPRGPDGAAYRVVRGGCWAFDPGYCLSAFRFGFGPEGRVVYLGFRVVAVPSGLGRVGQEQETSAAESVAQADGGRA